MLHNILCPDLEFVTFWVWTVCWLSSCVHGTVFALWVSQSQLCLLLFTQAPWDKKAVLLKVAQMLGYIQLQISSANFMYYFCEWLIYIFSFFMMFWHLTNLSGWGGAAPPWVSQFFGSRGLSRSMPSTWKLTSPEPDLLHLARSHQANISPALNPLRDGTRCLETPPIAQTHWNYSN